MKTNSIAAVILVCSFVTYSCEENIPAEVIAEVKHIPEVVDYNFHIKPVLSDRCFACHGPDAQKREADLRLDIPEEALAKLESGRGHAIVPGNPKKSQIIQRILSDDPQQMMPPPASNLSLNNREKALLLRWVEQNAHYKPHWAFTKPQKIKVPEVSLSDWPNNPIDHFILNKLEKQHIQPAPEAQKNTLVRRLFFDLTGLPPSFAELNHWMKENSPDWYERLVDHLLTRPAFGERMAAHWLDVARFADSEGYLDDFHHEFWPYRDWVIKAFNQNLPYDDFILWQVGGDQIPNATTDQILATAFNRNHKQNSEGGIIPEEFRVEQVADRTNTVGTAFLGMTVNCARCHDHKYDPISQENYYELFSFFNSTVERGDAIFSANAIEYGQMVSNFQSMNAGPVLALPSPEVAKIRTFLLQEIEKKQDTVLTMRRSNQKAFQHWASQSPSFATFETAIKKATTNHLTFDYMEDQAGKDLNEDNEPPRYYGNIKPVPGKKGQAVRSDANGQFIADGRWAIFERVEPFTISFWIKTPKVFESAHVIFNGNNRIQGYRGWDVVLDSNFVHFRLNHAHPYQSLEIRTPDSLLVNEWTHFVWTYDGSSDANGMRLYQNGKNIKPEIKRNFIYRSSIPYLDYASTVYMPYKGIVIGNRHYDQDFTGGLVDEVRILNQEAGQLVATYLFDEKLGQNTYTTALKSQSASLDEFFDLFIDPNLEKARQKLREIQFQEVTAIDTVQEIMVMGDYPNERPTYVLDRGVYDARGKRVARNAPNSILPWPEDLPRNRFGLGKWLIHPDNPLTARVAVNQIWYLMFGKGIVETVEDFGNQGALPTHPELLDWLAVDFMENEWNLKRLIKQIVTSSTYRQSSKTRPDLSDIDPDNDLLARAPRYRRSAEMVRDNILKASGLLNPTIGGPSTFPYQPPGLWKEVMTHPFFPGYQEDTEAGLYRRSIYTFWKRNMPAPNMLIFDASSRAECKVRRQRSSTPLQALVLLNDPQMIEGCRALSENALITNPDDIESALNQVFETLISRPPSPQEQKILKAQYFEEASYFSANPVKAQAYLEIGYRSFDQSIPNSELAALSRVANTILNTTEAYYKN